MVFSLRLPYQHTMSSAIFKVFIFFLFFLNCLFPRATEWRTCMGQQKFHDLFVLGRKEVGSMEDIQKVHKLKVT
jgi:hypothetical protein